MAQYNKKWTKESVIKYIEDNGYIFIKFSEELRGCETRIEVWCGNPNHKSYEVRFQHFKDNRRCKQCRKEEKLKWTKEKIIKYVEDNGYVFIKFIKFNYSKSIIEIWCGNSNHSHKISTFNDFQQNGRCRECGNENKIIWTKEKIIDFVENNNYNFIEFINYKSYLSRIKISCGKHGAYEVDFGNFKNGFRCPYCNMESIESKGEKEVEKILKKFKIKYNKQHTFEDCKYKKYLPFDFYLPDFNIIIEYDGEYHFEIIEHFGGFNKFIDTKIRDTIKNIYCKDNNIKLIRIPYWNFNDIDKILSKELKVNV